MKSETEFIKQLEAKAKEQQKLTETELIPDWAKRMGGWLATNPWRVIVPISVLTYLLLRTVYGNPYREFILGLFGGFR